MNTAPQVHGPDRLPTPQAWGAGLPKPGSARPAPAWFRTAWVVWSILWLLAWMTIGWLAFPWNILGIAVSAASALAFSHR
jgi:hypothetical protein